MSRAPRTPSREDVLDSFAMEQDHGRETLEKYLRTYPQFAPELVDLSRSLHRAAPPDDAPLSANDEAMIEAAWQRHNKAITTADPLARLSTEELRNIAQLLNVPRQVIAAFREHRVIIATVPKWFLAGLAEAANTTVDFLTAALLAPSPSAVARSFKAETTPESEGPVSFERLLIDAGVSDDERARLMAEPE